MPAPRPKPPRILIVEECLRDERGHYAGFVLGMAAWLAARGAEVEIWAHRLVGLQLTPPGVRLRAIFAESWIEGFWRCSRFDRVLLLLVHNARFLSGLRRAGRGGGGWNIVIATDVNIFHLFAWRLWLWAAPSSTRLALIAIQPPWLFDYSPTGEMRLKPQARLYRWALRTFAGDVASGRCRFATDAPPIRRMLAECSGLPFAEVSVPRTDVLLAGLNAPPPAQRHGFRLGVLGRPTRDKGFDRLLSVIALWQSRSAADRARVCFVVQWHVTQGASEDEHHRLLALAAAAPETVEIVESMLSEEQYAALLASLHGALLPYTRAESAGRASNVARDIFCAGRPIITTSGTWMAEQLAVSGAGITCGETPESIVAAIEEFARRYEELAALAQARRAVAREALSWERFFQQLGFDLVGTQ